MKRNNEKGVALIAAVMVVTILAGIGISFSFNMRLEEKAAANHLWRTQADAIAQGGIERAIQRLIERRDEQYTFIPHYETQDDPTLRGDLNIGIPVGGPRYQEAFTITFPHIDIVDGLRLRGGVVLRDEAGKVNLNTSGHPFHPPPFIPCDDHPNCPPRLKIPPEVCARCTPSFTRTGIDRGWTTAEISRPPIITSAVWSRKFGTDGQPGIAGDDDVLGDIFGHNSELIIDGIDNDGDGEVDEPGEGIDEPSEFRLHTDGRITLGLGDRPFITVGETGIEGVGDYVTLFSRDRRIDRDVRLTGTAEVDKININEEPVTGTYKTNLYNALIGAGIPNAAQVAVNIVDFRDADDNPTSWGGEIGIERTLFINEIEMDEYGWWKWYDPPEWWLPPFWYWVHNHKVDDIEFHNPWNTTVSGMYRVVWTNIPTGSPERNIFQGYVSILARGVSIRFGDYTNIDTNENPQASTITLYRQYAGAWYPIETIDIASAATDRYFAKNDPRVPIFVYDGRNSSLGLRNDFPPLQGFNPTVGGDVPIGIQWAGHFNHANRRFHNIGELGYIHTGGQWETLRMRDVSATKPHHGAILDRVTIGHPYNRMGRININTASLGVLTSLPQMGIQLGVQAQSILDNRPFHTIGDAVPYLTAMAIPPEFYGPRITQLMQDIVDFINWVLQVPIVGNFFAGVLAEGGIPVDGVPPQITLGDPDTREFVRSISRVVVHVTNEVIVFARGLPDPLGSIGGLINDHLIPIVRGATELYDYALMGDELDGDDFLGEDDELETIVRSVSNLITTRSDRFEIVSTGSVWRANEKLASSRMRAIVCRISVPPTILHFERR